MAFSDKLTVVIDFVTGPAQSGVKKLRTEVAQAEGAMGKMKAATVGVGGALNQYAGQAAMAAGAALVAFGVKSVKAFQDTALAARDFSNATGVAVEDASRLIEVAGDFGIEATALEGAILKMNKALGDGKAVFADYGVEVVRTESGVVDANATFINAITTIGKIQDPTKRAQAAQQAFGKSYGQVARFMSMSAEELREALAGVSEQQAISDEEAKRAEEFELALDNLQDTLTALSLEIGGELVPMLTSLADALSYVQSIRPDEDSLLGKIVDSVVESINPMERLKSVIQDVSDVFGDSGDKSETASAQVKEYATEALDPLAASSAEAAAMQEYYGSRADAAAAATRKARIETEQYDKAYSSLMGNLDKRESWRNVEDALAELQAKIEDGESSWGDLSEATDDAVKAMAEYIIGLKDVPQEVKTNLLTKLDQGDLDTVTKVLQGLQDGVNVPVRLIPKVSSGATTTITGDIFGRRYIPGQPNYVGATGGIVTRPTLATIGEAGPEAVVPLDRAPGASPLPTGRTSGGGDVYNIAIYPKTLPTDRELIDLINNVRRRNGNVI